MSFYVREPEEDENSGAGDVLKVSDVGFGDGHIMQNHVALRIQACPKEGITHRSNHTLGMGLQHSILGDAL